MKQEGGEACNGRWAASACWGFCEASGGFVGLLIAVAAQHGLTVVLDDVKNLTLVACVFTVYHLTEGGEEG